MTAHHRLRAGVYGQTFCRGRVLFADVEAVENFHAVPFTDEQLAAAAGCLPDRLIVIPPMPNRNPWRPPDAAQTKR